MLEVKYSFIFSLYTSMNSFPTPIISAELTFYFNITNFLSEFEFRIIKNTTFLTNRQQINESRFNIFTSFSFIMPFTSTKVLNLFTLYGLFLLLRKWYDRVSVYFSYSSRDISLVNLEKYFFSSYDKVAEWSISTYSSESSGKSSSELSFFFVPFVAFLYIFKNSS